MNGSNRRSMVGDPHNEPTYDWFSQPASPPVDPLATLYPPAPPPIMFEGEPVEAIRAKITAPTSVDMGRTHRIDDTVHFMVTGKVTRVDHVVEERSGRLFRIETIKVVLTDEMP